VRLANAAVACGPIRHTRNYKTPANTCGYAFRPLPRWFSGVLRNADGRKRAVRCIPRGTASRPPNRGGYASWLCFAPPRTKGGTRRSGVEALRKQDDELAVAIVARRPQPALPRAASSAANVGGDRRRYEEQLREGPLQVSVAVDADRVRDDRPSVRAISVRESRNAPG
jgi:hypothetical protein